MDAAEETHEVCHSADPYSSPSQQILTENMEERLLEENGQMLLIPKKEEEEEMEVTASTQTESSTVAFNYTETPAKTEVKTEPEAEMLITDTDSTVVMLYVDSVWKEHIDCKTEDSEDDTSNSSSSSSSSSPSAPVLDYDDDDEGFSQPAPIKARDEVLLKTAESDIEMPYASPTQLPRLWAETLPPEDHKWIVQTLLKMGPKGKLELRADLKLWYQPPQPSQLYHQAPAPDHFFAHPLLVWMPHKLWRVKVVCPNPACGRQQLKAVGLHKKARRVLDVDRVYIMVTETLACSKCKAAHVSWSQTVLTQLDLAHRLEFRVVLTKKYACDIRVIRLLQQRGLGYSPTRVLKQLKQNHTEEWLHRVARYTTECVDFLQHPGLLPTAFPEPPEPAVVPSCRWLLSVYSQDILTRLEEIQARITSTYGSILKLHSTKKITKKLGGTAKGTALWLTSVGNEYGQILISVLTAQEGSGLDFMAADLVKRYQRAGVDPPVALYVDCGCCVEAGETKLKTGFTGWPDLTVRLDVWHFMRRLAVGCTTDAHQLYPVFMSHLSACIFEWDADDLAKLRRAKKQLLQSQGVSLLSDGDIDKHLTREELCLHCRRRTRGEETTSQLLEELLQVLMGSRGNDSFGVPLFDRQRMEHIWSVQKKHVKCIQDPPGVILYIKTGELSKGGVQLPVYRCARGSTSLESFHLHLNCFIPGTSANSLNFQIYLLEGIHRWNQDRRGAALSTGPSGLRSFSGDLLHCVNKNYERLFGRKVAPEFCPPAPYTGELIGIQYLFRQTGQALQDMNPDAEVTAQLLEEHDVEDDAVEEEGFSDTMDPTVSDMNTPFHWTGPTSSSSLDLGPSMLPAGSSTSPACAASSLVSTSTSTAAMTCSASTYSSSSSEATDKKISAVDAQNIPGYQHVDRLAAYLVELREQEELYLNHRQATRIIELWDKLDDWDKQQVVYAARHQQRLSSGRFRTPKQPSSVAGVESTTRCMLGASSAPAQTPSCCRLVENIFIGLCTLHPSPKRKGKAAESRWSLILRDYRKIRQLVMGNASVMSGSKIQLVEVNQATVIDWHNARVKDQERTVLQQGIALPPALPVASEPLQEARVLPVAPEPPQQEHQYQLPQSTAGQAQQRQRAILPKTAVKRQLFAQPPAPEPGPPLVYTPAGQSPMIVLLPANQGTNTQISLATPVPPPDTGARSKRSYTRTVAANSCKKCGQFRTAATGHSQLRGRVYCPQAETVSKEEWLEGMRRKYPK